MDRHRFDALARLLATTGSRRATLGALFGVSLLGHDPDLLAKRGKSKGKDQDTGHDVQGEGRPGAKHKQHHQHKQTQRHRRKKRDRHDRGGNPKPGREDGVCCGATTQCDPPAPGSSRVRCDFNEQSFTGQDLHGADFLQIAGASTTFDGADLHDAVFIEACLRRATFRGANLAGTTWGGACLFAADFTEADLGDDPEALDGAVLCATILPDGTRSDRDCGQSPAYPCCLPPPGGGGGGPNPFCEFDSSGRGCNPNVCWCPDAGCCPDPLDVCQGEPPHYAVMHCCKPNCAGRQCGWGGCGSGQLPSAPGPCGACRGTCRACDDARGICINSCDRGCCPTGCCAPDGTCQPGTTTQQCGRGGDPCQACPAGQECVDHHCVCTAQSCPHGCCSDGPGNAGICRPGNRIEACGRGGARCASCSETQTCQGNQCVGCGSNCVCAGQSFCNGLQTPNVHCGVNRTGDACYCVVSRTGQPFCTDGIRSFPICTTDADCQGVFPGGVCVNYAPDSEWCTTAGNFCARPCRK